MVKDKYHGLEIVVPDDYPPIISDSLPLMRIQKECPIPVKIHSDRARDAQSLIGRIQNAHTIMCMNSSTSLGSSVIESCPNLRHIALWGGATEHVDINSANLVDVVVTNAPGSYTETVAEHALALTLALARRLPELNERVRTGEWPGRFVTQLTGKVMGIIGGGRIARRMAEISAGIGMKVMLCDPETRETRLGAGVLPGNFNKVGMATLLHEADVISLHTRPGTSSRRLFGREEFAKMKTTALFINTAHNRLVDEQALATALRSETIAGAALDVFDNEPLGKKSPFSYLPNTIVTPHISAHTQETVDKSLNIIADNVINFFKGRVQNVVKD